MLLTWLAAAITAILYIITTAFGGDTCIISGGADNRSKSHGHHNGQHDGPKLSDFEYDPAIKDIAERVMNMIAKYRVQVSPEMLQQILRDLAIYKDKKFNRCWMAEYLPHWRGPLKSQVDIAPWREKPVVRYLQIGVFEGMSLLYLTQIILAGMKLEITVIDDFSTEQYFGTEETFDANTAGLSGTSGLRKIRADSNSALVDLIAEKAKFDFIYCSGSRKPYVCIVDFALLSRVTEPGSYLLLDDYRAFSSYEGDISPDKVKDIFMQANKRFHTHHKIGGQDLMVWLEVAPDDYIPRVKPADCVNRG